MTGNSEKHSWLGTGRYYALRIALVIAACVLLAVALISMYTSTRQGTRAQELAIEMVQSEDVAETLLLASFDGSDVPTKKQRDAISDILHRSAVAVDVGYLDAADSTRGYASGEELVNTVWGRGVEAKLGEHGPYDCIICLDDESLNFVEATYDTNFAGTPVVFFGINNEEAAQRVYNKGYATGIIEDYDTPRFIDVLRGIRPNASNMLVITDDTDSGIGIRQQFDEVIAQHPDLSVEYVNASQLTRDELGKAVSDVTDKTIVIYLSARNDADGNGYSTGRNASFLSSYCPEPIFSAGFFGVGEGFTGSDYIDYIGAGEEAAGIVLSVLNGTNPTDIDVSAYSSNGSVYDARQLSSMGISKSSLPIDATFINQSGFNSDAVKPIILPILMLLLGGICIALFALFGYMRSKLVTQQIMDQGNMLEQHFYINKLTDKPNMQWLTSFASSGHANGVRSIIALSLLGMETIDDSYGPGTADSVVKQLAHRLEGVPSLFLVQSTNVEFILGISHALKPGDEIFETVDCILKAPFEVDEQKINIKACVAVCNREHIMSLEEMVAGVEIAINQAIQVGNTDEVIFYDRDLRSAVEDNMEVATALRKAIANEGFYVVYQPQVDLENMRVVGYEALARMKGDAYSPEEFMPIAELNGQLVDIDRIVSKMVVQQLAKWKRRKQRMRTVTINHGLGQLRDKEFIDYMVGLMDRYGLAHSLLCFDLKESLFINNMTSALGFTEELKKAGFSCAVDNFGDGYMSVQRVMALPADVVKINESLTRSFLLDGEQGVVGNLVRLVHSAGKTVVIEGVETLEQVEMCQSLGCDIVQGFFFAEPMRPERAIQFKPTEIIIGGPATSENAATANSKASKTERQAATESALADAGEMLLGEVSAFAEVESLDDESEGVETAVVAESDDAGAKAEKAVAEEEELIGSAAPVSGDSSEELIGGSASAGDIDVEVEMIDRSEEPDADATDTTGKASDAKPVRKYNAARRKKAAKKPDEADDEAYDSDE